MKELFQCDVPPSFKKIYFQAIYLYSVLKSIFVCMCELCEDFPNYSAALTAGRTIGWVITENN